MKKLSTLSVLALMATTAFAQQRVSDGTANAAINPNAIVEMQSNNKGLLQPRVALTMTTNAAPLAAHVAGMHVYNTATAGDVTPGEYYNDGTRWVRLISANNFSPAFGSGAPTGSCVANTLYTDTLTNSPTQGQQWACSGGSWASYTPPAGTEWWVLGNTNDAGSDKIGQIYRRGNVIVGDATTGDQLYMVTGSNRSEIYFKDLTTPGLFSIRAGNITGSRMMEFLDVTAGSARMVISNSGNVGIGTNAPTNKLEVNNGTTNGAVKIVDGTQAAGKVLTSDANGVATWQHVGQAATVVTQSGSMPLTTYSSSAYTNTGVSFNLPKAGTYIIKIQQFFQWGSGCQDLFYKFSGATITGQTMDEKRQLCGNPASDWWNAIYYVTVNAAGTINLQYKVSAGTAVTLQIASGTGNALSIN